MGKAVLVGQHRRQLPVPDLNTAPTVYSNPWFIQSSADAEPLEGRTGTFNHVLSARCSA